MKNLSFLILIGFVFFSCEESINETISLNDGWQFSEMKSSDWKSAEVPGRK